MAGKKDETKLIPVDLQGHPLVEYTEEQWARKKELEYERLMKTSNKGIYNKWSREEKHLLITWAQNANFDLLVAEFKHIVEGFITYQPTGKNYVLRSLPKIDNSGRELDVLCMYCARIHSFTVAVGFRDTWIIDAPCTLDRRPESGKLEVDDKHIPIAKWETTWLEE